MTETPNQSVAILGVNGRVGLPTARAFAAAGWQVTGLGRTDRFAIPGVRFVVGDADDPSDVARAASDSAVVVDAVNLAYDRWGGGRYEKSLAARLVALAGSGKTLLFPGNIYNYSAQTPQLRPDSPQLPARDKGEIRVRLEAMLEAASAHGDLKVVILRAPDFIGPEARGTLIDMLLLRHVGKGILTYPGDPAIGHSYAYLPDLARAFVRIAEARQGLAPFDRLHFSGHFRTGYELADAVARALGRPLKLRRANWLPYRALGLVVPILGEVVKMNYLWSTPHRLIDPRLDDLLGPDFQTPFEEAIARTVRTFLPPAATAKESAPSMGRA